MRQTTRHGPTIAQADHDKGTEAYSLAHKAEGYNRGVSTQQKTELQDYYGLLHVAPDATHLEIRRAFRALARRLHPDVNPAADAAELSEEPLL